MRKIIPKTVNPIAKIIRKYWQNGFIPFLLIAAVSVYMLRLSWLKWADLVIDVGREMHMPLEILKGRLIYRDFAYIYGPLPPYFNSLLFLLFGVRLSSLYLNGLCAFTAACFLIYKIARFYLNTFFSTLAAVTFIVVFAFGQYLYLGTYNFMLPYSYASVDSLVFALAAVFFFRSALFNQKRRFDYLSGFFIGLALLSKIEVGAALLASAAAAVIFYAFASGKKPLFKFFLSKVMPYLLLPAGIAGFFYGLLFFNGADLSDATALIISNNSNAAFPFPRWLSGINNLSLNLKIIFLSSVSYLLLIFLFMAGGVLVKKAKEAKMPFSGRPLFMVTLSFFILAALFFVKDYFPFEWQYRPAPLVLLASIFILIWQAVKSREPSLIKENSALFFLAALSFLLLVRMLFFVRVAHYGFYLLVPGMLLYYVFFLKFIPDFFNSRMDGRFYGIGFTAVFLFFIFANLNISKFCYRNKTLKLSVPRGTVYLFNNNREYNCAQLVEYLRQNTDKNAKLVIFPEGLPINFLSERENPLYYSTYIPTELIKKGAYDRIIRELDEGKVSYIAIIQRETYEFGFSAFGTDYAQDIMDYIKDNYQLVKQFGPFPFTTQEFGIALFKRRGDFA